MTLRVLITCPQMQNGIDEFREAFDAQGIDLELPSLQQQLEEDELIPIIGDFDGVIAGDDPFTHRVLERAKRLRIISKWGVGIDNIDLAAARVLGIKVTNTPSQFGSEVADVVIGYIILLARRLHEIDRAVREGRWLKVEGLSLAGKTLGIVGLGTIGQAVARRTLAMDMKVLGHDPAHAQRAQAEALGVVPVAVDQLLAASDFVSLSCPLTVENEHMLGRNQFSLMKPGSFLINTARGRLVDESALIEALEAGSLAGAALDVFENEPLRPDSPLVRLGNCILGSHNSSNTAEAARRVNQLAVRNLLDGLLP